MQQASLKDLLEAGCHFGHQVNRWHPKAHTFIFQARDGIHIIDLAKTKAGLESAAAAIRDLGARNAVVLFVGTKRQAKATVTEEASRVGASYLSQKWIGGFFTNWEGVKKNIDKLNTLRNDRDTGGWDKFPKHEQVAFAKQIKRLELFYGGVSTLTKLPDAVFIIDIRKDDSAVREARIREIPTVAIVDTNSDPSLVNYAIPANDDAVGSITFITKFIADAYLEGKNIAAKTAAAEKDKLAKDLERQTEAAKASKEVTQPKTEDKKPKAEAAKDKEDKPVKMAKKVKEDSPKKASPKDKKTVSRKG